VPLLERGEPRLEGGDLLPQFVRLGVEELGGLPRRLAPGLEFSLRNSEKISLVTFWASGGLSLWYSSVKAMVDLPGPARGSTTLASIISRLMSLRMPSTTSDNGARRRSPGRGSGVDDLPSLAVVITRWLMTWMRWAA